MKESDTIDFKLAKPNTIASIRDDLIRLGVSKGMTLIVHSSLSSMGWVCGGAAAVILALEDAIGETGTLVMPAHTGDLSDPSEWNNPPVPETWWQTIRDTMPPFYLDLTPTRGVGIIPETFRKQRGVLRSQHPNVSFTAWGKQKEHIIENHDLDFSLDIQSPLGKIYQMDGCVLLLGVDHDRNTSLHLAEYMAEINGKAAVKKYAPILRDGMRQWAEYSDINYADDDFTLIGKEFESTGKCEIGKVGLARAVLMRQKDLVNFACEWMLKNRK